MTFDQANRGSFKSNTSNVQDNKHDFYLKEYSVPTFCEQCTQILSNQGFYCKSSYIQFNFYNFSKMSSLNTLKEL